MRIIQRASSFIERSKWLNHFMPSYCATVAALVHLKTRPEKEMMASYTGMPFSFKAKDMSAIREVLADEEYKFLKDYLADISHPTILDIGANIGTFALWCLGTNMKSHILSVEAGAETFTTLDKNTNLARQSKNVSWKALHRAAWKNNDIVSFNDSHESMAGKISSNGKQSVQGISLKELVKTQLDNTGAEYIDVLKIDIEGSEEHFLSNTEENSITLDKVKRLVIELHPSYCNVSGVETLIKSKFSKVQNCTDRLSNKPLLDCYN